MLFTIVMSAIGGALLLSALMMFVMRRYMICAYKMDAPYDKVCTKIEEAIKSVPGWGHPLPDWDFHAAVNKTHYFNNLKKKRIFFICKAEYANRIVDNYHHMGAMMPCAWAVYETMKGEVFMSKMNIALMSKMFLGNIIGSTMSKVGHEEHQMLKELHRLLAA
ncbi:MAG: DUF302 domain-containing protein [Sedimentisphaerales bacterium]|nr:DUF302 domain-containing protein [Sedimentisphaerales bacterium]